MIRFIFENVLKGIGVSIGFFLGMFLFIFLIHAVVPDKYIQQAKYEHETFKKDHKVSKVWQS